MSISVMLKPASGSCNLKCEYCFYRSLTESRAESLKGFMSLDTAKSVIASALDFAKGSEVIFTFQGGEPLLRGLDFFKEFVDYANSSNKNKARISYCLQTNGTLIDEEYARFFKENRFLIGVSLDGDSEINKYRVYPDGSDSFDDVVRGINLLKKYDVTFNILSVLTKNTALNFRKAYRFFKQNDLRYLQFIPCLKPFDESFDESIYMNNDDYEYFLKKCFNIYFNDYMRGDYVSVRSFDNYMSLMKGGNAEQCGMNGFCSTQFVVEGDGSVYPCDFYCTDDWYLGSINESSFDELYHGERAVEFLKNSFLVDDKCKSCDYFYICRGGGCKRNRLSADFCKAYKNFFSDCVYKMQQMKGRS